MTFGFLGRNNKRDKTKSRKVFDAFKKGVADELGISKFEVDRIISNEEIRNLQYLKNPRSNRMEAFQSGKQLAKIIKNLSVKKVVEKYAEGISDTTGKSFEEVMQSEPVKNFKKRLL